MDPPFGHHELHNRYLFGGTLVLESPLRLSSGRASARTDAPLMRDRSGRPFIPGTSLRGALRSALERVLAGAGEASGISACTLFTEEEGDDACVTVSRTKQETLIDLDEQDGDKALEYAEEHLCDLCKLFGSPVYASRLVVEDAYPRSSGALEDRSLIRDGVGIDRDTGRAKENVKFDFEVLDPGKDALELDLRMEAENLGATDRKILDLAFGLMRQGLFLGGKRSAGLGRVRLKDEDLAVRGFESAEQLWEALSKGEDPHRELSWKEGRDASA